MAPYTVKSESKLSDDEIAKRAAFIASAFSEDPISRFLFGDEYKDNPRLWESSCENDLRKAETIGKVWTTLSQSGEIMAIAVAFTAGHDIGDLPNSEETDGLLAALPDEQKAFRRDYFAKQASVYKATYPTDVKRDNVYLHHFCVKDGHRGEGIGSTLVQRVIEDVQAGGHRLIVDTSKSINVSFYQKNGVKLNAEFEVIHYKYGALPRSFVLATE